MAWLVAICVVSFRLAKNIDVISFTAERLSIQMPWHGFMTAILGQHLSGCNARTVVVESSALVELQSNTAVASVAGEFPSVDAECSYNGGDARNL